MNLPAGSFRSDHRAGPRESGSARARRWLTMGMPLGISLAIHAALLLTAGAVAWRLAATPQEPEATDAFLAVTTPMSTAEPNRPAMVPPVQVPVPATPIPATQGAGPDTARRLVAEPLGRVTIEPAPPEVREAPPAGAATSALNPGETTSVAFAGLSAKRASSVAYVIDASAPMIGVLPRVLAEVRASTAALLPAQQVGIVIFHDGHAEVFAPRLADATPRNLSRIADWLGSVEAQGRSSPLEGLRAALALKPRPRVVFLLSRSIARSHGGQWESGLEAILAELETLNPADPATGQRPTVIKALQFLESDPTGTMQAIAQRHGGGGTSPDYRVLKAEELPR